MKRLYLYEILLYAVIFLVALCMPVFTDVFEQGRWSELLRTGMMLLPFVFIFLINNFIFIPRLLFTERYLYYFLSCILLVTAVFYISFHVFDLIHFMRPAFDGTPQYLPLNGNMPSDAMSFQRKDMMRFQGNPRRHLMFIFGQAIVSFLLIGFNSGVKSFIRWSEERERQSERERRFLHTELAFLKHQISPHFFMNTLNNIHSLIDIDTEKARDAIVKLSRLMRYMLYETDLQKVSLKKEIEFIESFIELMRLRYDEKMLTVETEYPSVTYDIFVPSFLFISFIENAFKHGVILHDHSLIRIRFVNENGRLAFSVCNNKSEAVSSINEGSGIGLENVRKRLELIFMHNYTLDIQTVDDTYSIYLNIPL